jgi:hypothetical protein
MQSWQCSACTKKRLTTSPQIDQSPNNCLRTMVRVGQNRIVSPYMTVILVVFLPNKPYIHRIHMVMANPNDGQKALEGARANMKRQWMARPLSP